MVAVVAVAVAVAVAAVAEVGRARRTDWRLRNPPSTEDEEAGCAIADPPDEFRQWTQSRLRDRRRLFKDH
jgi:hypothetical protein